VSRIHPVQQLLDEHRLIEDILNAFAGRLRGLPAAPFSGNWFFNALDFFRHFVEGCHHNREEEIVFPQLRAAGLLEEHDAGAAYLDRLETILPSAWDGDFNAIDQFRHEGLAYIHFLREHIIREDELLHWVAGQPSTEKEIDRLQDEAEPEQYHHMDSETYQKYVAVANRLLASQAA
jgi:hemerythrin-like domain-containing protein